VYDKEIKDVYEALQVVGNQICQNDQERSLLGGPNYDEMAAHIDARELPQLEHERELLKAQLE
jgi:hypothetical protein